MLNTIHSQTRNHGAQLGLIALGLAACPVDVGPPMNGSGTSTGGSGTTVTGESGSDDTALPVGCGDGIAEPGEFCFDNILVPEVQYPIDIDAVEMDLGYSFVAITLGDAMIYRVSYSDGTLNALPVAPVPVSAESRIHVAGLHATGRSDIAITSILYPTMHVVENLWTALEVPTSSSVGPGPGVFMDVEADGVAELIAGWQAKAFLWSYDPNADTWTQQLAEYAIPGCGILWASTTADFNGDSLDDVAYIGSPKPFTDGEMCDNVGFHRISVIVSDPDFGYPVVSDSILPGFAPDEIEAGDFDGDGKFDLAVVSSDAFQQLAVLPGLGDGTFAAPVPIEGVYSYLSVGNVDGDPDDEIVTNNGHIVIVDSPLTTPAVHDLGLLGRPQKIADVNADGVGDLAYAGSPGGVPTSLVVLVSAP